MTRCGTCVPPGPSRKIGARPWTVRPSEGNWRRRRIGSSMVGPGPGEGRNESEQEEPCRRAYILSGIIDPADARSGREADMQPRGQLWFELQRVCQDFRDFSGLGEREALQVLVAVLS